MEPVTGTITASQWLMAGSNVVGAALRGGGTPSPSTAISDTRTQTNSWLDGSNFTVATGNARAEGGDNARSESSGSPFAPGTLQSIGAPSWLTPFNVALILAGLFAWKKIYS